MRGREITVKKNLLLLLLTLLCFVACGDDDLPEDYIIVDSKIVAVKIEEPEAMEGDTISMKLLIAKNDIDQNSEIPVTWTIGGDVGYSMESNYNEALELIIPDVLPDGEDSVDVPVVAAVTIDGKVLSALKLFRVTNNPIWKNPVITGIQLDWLIGAELQTSTITNGSTLSLASGTENVACTAITEELPDDANGKLVYRWYISRAVDSNREIEISEEVDDIEALLGEGARAAEFRKSVVYDVLEKQGTYSAYLVVRDNNLNSTDSSEDRLGTDFYYFTIVVE